MSGDLPVTLGFGTVVFVGENSIATSGTYVWFVRDKCVEFYEGGLRYFLVPNNALKLWQN